MKSVFCTVISVAMTVLGLDEVMDVVDSDDDGGKWKNEKDGC